MTRTDRFKDLAEFRAEKERLAAVRDLHAQRLENHFNALKEGGFRTSLLKNTVGGALGSFAPGRILGNLLGGGGLAGGLSMAVGSGKGGLLKRAGLFALGLAAPKLMQGMGNLSMADLGHELSVSWGRLQDYMRDRRTERAED